MTKDAAPGSPAASSQPGDDGAEVAGERVEVVTYAAAIDVAKGFGMVCTRVPGSPPPPEVSPALTVFPLVRRYPGGPAARIRCLLPTVR